MRTALEKPGAYGRRFRRVTMAFEAVTNEETDDYYVVTLSFRPQGIFSGTPGQEQFFIEKEGASRIVDQAQGGEILVSSLLKELTDSAGDISFGEAQEVKLKGLAGLNRVYPVEWK